VEGLAVADRDAAIELADGTVLEDDVGIRRESTVECPVTRSAPTVPG
jgi:hypothetical protein